MGRAHFNLVEHRGFDRMLSLFAYFFLASLRTVCGSKFHRNLLVSASRPLGFSPPLNKAEKMGRAHFNLVEHRGFDRMLSLFAYFFLASLRTVCGSKFHRNLLVSASRPLGFSPPLNKAEKMGRAHFNLVEHRGFEPLTF